MSTSPSPNRAWAIGQKVRCLDDAFPRCIHDWCDSLPVAGEVYTIRGLQLGSDPTTGVLDLGFLLAGLSNPRKANGAETRF